MPSIGDKKNVQYTLYKEDIDNDIWVADKITRKMMKAVAWGICGGLGAAAKKFLAGFIIGGVASLESDVFDDIIDNYIDDLEEYLETIKEGNAEGIKVTKPMVYMYMSGSGTGWYTGGRAKIQLVY